MGCISGIYDLVRIPIKKPCRGYYLRWYYNGWHYWFFLPGKYSVIAEGENYKTIGTRKIDMGSGQIDRNQAEVIRTITNTREVYLLTIYGWMNIRIDPSSLIMYDHRQEGLEIEIAATIGSKEISYDTGLTPVPIIPVVPPSTGYCDLDIFVASQTWMCKNWDSTWPGSRVYDNDEGNRPIYGGLYTYAQIMTVGFVPSGYHVPSLAEWQALIIAIGGDAVAGGELKETGLTHWITPNTGAVDTYGFAALGGGIYNIFTALFESLNEDAYFLTADLIGGFAATIHFNYNTGAITISYINPSHFVSLRLIKDTTLIVYTGYGLLYNWFTVIPREAELISSWTNATWDTFTSSGVNITHIVGDNTNSSSCFSNVLAVAANDVINFHITVTINSGDPPYLYIWEDGGQFIYPLSGGENFVSHECSPTVTTIYANITNNDFLLEPGTYHNVDCSVVVECHLGHDIAPAGWHVPTWAELITLQTFLGGVAVAGGKLKAIGTIYWDPPNTGADNSSKFNAKGSGSRESGLFGGYKSNMYFVASDDYAPTQAIAGVLDFNSADMGIGIIYKEYGVSIRAIKDSTILSDGETGTVTDIDGNVYPTICIGTKEYMASNLKVTHYNDGAPIPEETNNAAWAALTIGARCWYNNTPS